MPNTRLFQQSFAGGEISPLMYARLADTKNRSGAARLRNMIVTPTGAAVRRPGTRFIREVKDSTKATVIRRFAYSATQQLALEIGVGYFRMHQSAATVTYASPKMVTSVDQGNETITCATPHGFTNGASVRFLYGAGAGISGINDLTTYVVATTPSTTTLTLTGVNFTGAVTGSVALIDAAEMPEEYVGSEAITFAHATDSLTFDSAPHGFADDDPVNLTGTLPDGLSLGTTYYLRDFSGTWKLSTTAGGSAIALSNNGTGVTMHYAYSAGDLVHTTGVGVYYTEIDLPSGVAGNFYLMPLPADDCVFEIPNSYIESNLFYLKFRQQGSTLTITHPDHSPLRLTRLGDISWTIETVDDYGPTIATPTIDSITPNYGEYWQGYFPPNYPYFVTSGAKHTLGPGDAVYLEGAIGQGTDVYSGSLPAGIYLVNDLGSGTLSATQLSLRTLVGGTASNTSGLIRNGVMRRVSASSETSETYVITALTEDGEETEPSAEHTENYNPLYVSGSYNTLAWTAVAGAARYRVYKKQTGLFGFIGETETTSFKDDNITPDLGITPPRLDDTLDTPGNPGCSTYFEQRTVYSGKETDPQRLWLTSTGSEDTLAYHLPVIDTDRINFVLAAPESCYVQHVVPQANLIVLTNAVEFVVTPVNTDAITPTSFRARPVTYVGSSHVAPLLTGSSLLFCAARGGHVREFGRVSDQGYVAGDVSLRAAHLFDGLSITDSALMKAPYPIAWFINSNGDMLGFTYSPEEELGGWHLHTTNGDFESVCCISEGTEDALYFVAQRAVNGGTARYIERMEPFALPAVGYEFYVDCGLQYDGVSTSTISGLDHLEDATVQVFVAGSVFADQTVASGAIDLSWPDAGPVALATIGLGYPSELRTLPVVMQIDQAFGRGRTHNVNKLWVRVANSYRFQAGPAEDELVNTNDIAVETRVDEVDIDVHIPGDWTDTGQVWIKQSDPVPLTVVSLCAEVSIGS